MKYKVMKYKVIKKFYTYLKGDILEVVGMNDSEVTLETKREYEDTYELSSFSAAFGTFSKRRDTFTHEEIEMLLANEYITPLDFLKIYEYDDKTIKDAMEKEINAAYEMINKLQDEIASLRNDIENTNKIKADIEKLFSVITELLAVYEEDLKNAEYQFNNTEISATQWAEQTTVLNNLIKVLKELQKFNKKA